MKIKTWIKYEVPYLPPRCRKMRYEEKEEFVDITLREASKKDMVLAYEDRSYDGKGKIYRYNGKLWAKAKLTHLAQDEQYGGKIKTALDWLVYCNQHCSTYFFHRMWDKDSSREGVIKRAKKDMAKRLLVNGVLYEKVSKPEYHIQTFGVYGDGTGLFVRYPARRDCGWNFPAEKGKEAVAKAKEIARGRGDFKDARYFREYIVCHEGA